MSALDDAPRFQPVDRAAWRDWLSEHHAQASGVWVVTFRAATGKPSPSYEELVLEALCVGWVDGTRRRIDDERTALYFTRRRKGSGWAATNKARVERLVAAGLMRPAGQAAIDRARADGSWSRLDRSDAAEPPAELLAALDRYPGSRVNYEAFPLSVRKQLVFWVADAKRPATRERRADTVARRAQRNLRGNEP